MKCQKVQYKDHPQAVRAIHIILSKGVKKKFTPVRAYKCEECNLWHITHRSIEEYLEHYGESFDLKFTKIWKKLQNIK